MRIKTLAFLGLSIFFILTNSSYADELSNREKEQWSLKLRADIEDHLLHLVETKAPNKSVSDESISRPDEHYILVITKDEDGVTEMSCHDGPDSAAETLFKSEKGK